MNRTTDNTTLLSCGVAFLNPAEISPDLHAALIVKIAVNALTCPLIVFLNILVMVAVKTKQQLRSKSNVALACLATTDLVVGLVVQPLQIANTSLLMNGQQDMFYAINDVSQRVAFVLLSASLHHFVLMSAERYLAIKHPFTHENRVTEVRIIIASGLAWATAMLLPTQDLWLPNRKFQIILGGSVILFLFLPTMVYLNVAVYKEIRRSERQIAANQVSLEAKEKILKNKKAFYTTTIVLLAIFLCYVPIYICFAVLGFFKDRISANIRHIILHLVVLLPVLNSLFNPLLYAVRVRHFRVAFIQLLSRKSLAQAEELELNIFGPRQIGGVANVEQERNGANQEENEQQGNETLNSAHENTARTTQPQQAYEQSPL